MANPISSRRTALLLIDIQQGFNHPTHWGTTRSTPEFEKNVERLLKAFREQKSGPESPPLVVHVWHSSGQLNSPLHPSAGDGVRFQPYASPVDGEPVFSKHVNSAFIGTKLEELLRLEKIQQLVICGMTTDHCVSTTTRMAANLGVTDQMGHDGQLEQGTVILVGDACATHDRARFDAETMHAVSLASLDGEFARVMSTSDVLQSLFGRV